MVPLFLVYLRWTVSSMYAGPLSLFVGRSRVVAVLLAGIVWFLSACGGENSSGPIAPPTVRSGAIVVTVRGAPDSVAITGRVEAADGTRIPLAFPSGRTGTLGDRRAVVTVPRGVAVVRWDTTAIGAVRWVPLEAEVPAVVNTDSVRLEAVFGKRLPETATLTLDVVGVPTKTSASIQVIDAKGVARAVLTSGALTVAYGPVVLQASRVNVGVDRYDPSVRDTVVEFAGDSARAGVRIAYRRLNAVVRVGVRGLPRTSEGVVQLQSATATRVVGVAEGAADSARHVAVAAGAVTALWNDVEAEGHTFVPAPRTQRDTVLGGDTLRVEASYTIATGSIALLVQGLPAGAAGDVQITGPGGFERRLTQTKTLTNLPPGIYTVTTNSVVVATGGDSAFYAGGTVRAVTVGASLVAVPTTAFYALRPLPRTGTLEVRLSGLPRDTVALRLTSSTGRVLSVTSPRATLEAGTYRVEAIGLRANGYRYAGQTAPSVTVEAGRTVSLAVAYQATTGKLLVAIDGVAGPIPITVATPGVSTDGASNTAVEDLAPGVATVVVPSAVITNGRRIVPTQTTWTTTVVAGQEARLTVSSRDAGTGLADYRISSTGLAQTTYTSNGDGVYVAGRPLLLVATLIADTPNTESPRLDVELLDGDRPYYRTAMTKAAPGVPTRDTATSPIGQINTEYHVILPGNVVGAGMRVRLHVVSPDRDSTNNVWPRAEAAPLNVIETTSARIVFVPLTINGVTGQGSPSLGVASRLLPFRDIATTTGAPLDITSRVANQRTSPAFWYAIMSALEEVRLAAGADDQTFYVGLVPGGTAPAGFAGFALIGGRVSALAPSADGLLFAHELGHNLGLGHSSCGNPANITNPERNTNTWGWTGAVTGWLTPTTPDFMGYCGGWIGGGTWNSLTAGLATNALPRGKALTRSTPNSTAAEPTVGIVVTIGPVASSVRFVALPTNRPASARQAGDQTVLIARAADGREIGRGTAKAQQGDHGLPSVRLVSGTVTMAGDASPPAIATVEVVDVATGRRTTLNASGPVR